MASDEAVQATNDDATQCKRHAVEKGYWKDPYLSLFTTKGPPRQPEINRGYYARVKGLRFLLDKFLKLTEGKCQVVNLGSGFDTTYWLLKDQNLAPKDFVEVDFPVVTHRKCHIIRSRKQLLEKVATEDGEIRLDGTHLHGEDYHLVGVNLGDLKELDKQLDLCEVDRRLPTVFIAECVLVYVNEDKCQQLLKWIADNFHTALFLNYEQVNMADRFGQVMVENLKSRDCTLSGINACQTLETQRQRFLSQGWECADAMQMIHVYSCLPQDDIQRMERLEFLDERELIDQLFSHYCIAWAYKDKDKIGLEEIDFS